MKYKLLGLAIVFLTATPPIFSASEMSPVASKMSPIIVKTGKPVPSTVRSGEPFTITYQVEYTDMVVIIEEQMRMDSLILVADDKSKLKTENSVTGDVEVLGLVIGKKFRDGSEELGFVNIQDFTYTFMIINEQKGNYKIPSFNFVWVEKEAGTTLADTKEKKELQEFPTKEVGISYVTSVVRPPPVDVRDMTRFDTFGILASRLLKTAYIIIILAFLGVLISLIRFFRSPKALDMDKNKAGETGEEIIFDRVVPTLSSRKARKKFLKELKLLETEVGSAVIDNESTKELTRKLYSLTRPLLLAELAEERIVEFPDADTPKEMHERLQNLSSKQRKQLGRKKYNTILELSRKAADYYYENAKMSPIKEVDTLKSLVENIDLRNKIRSFINKSIRLFGSGLRIVADWISRGIRRR
ncbi:MAG: hypothetical protein A3J46_02950 [Candidatus Yanofskybacteria bacterium RIFCSPHIGHO2_02_FULL_41_11]|uniref:DUF5667 domain-containing protein n=1 Tax=Candidatus Yanofskybacteria bacterium RIFCSPHIGHO2_02_FULL_41_11 TaxID=1802675 RepID=A0A1F8F659_9BACT|nr:MAG: hypothetical protein A3J46_02950 [Candidatus Yanofskybacteria bacterium RIFCSPHIGHO2_02_FULL_41_11]